MARTRSPMPPSPPRLPLHLLLSLALLFALLSSSARAQCEGRWLNSPAQIPPGVDGSISDIVRMPNGDIVVAGYILGIGGRAMNHVARWNGREWLPVGSGTNARVNKLAVLPNGDLVAAGEFTMAGNTPANYIARWNGSEWLPFHTGPSGPVLSLVVMPNGDLVIGGGFGSASGVLVYRIARWNGATWEPFSSGVTNGVVYDFALLPNGDLVAGGNMTLAGSVPVSRLARWNGTAWSSLAGGVFSENAPSVNDLLVMPNGDLIVSGNFQSAGGVPAQNLARWNGTSWSTLGNGYPRGGLLLLRANGDLVVSGGPRVYRWNGAAWSIIGDTIAGAFGPMLELPDNKLFATGSFVFPGDLYANGPSAWDGLTWTAFNEGISGGTPFSTSAVSALATLQNGDLVASGTFPVAGGVKVNGLARWDGLRWTPFGPGDAYRITVLRVLANGDLLAGGSFNSINGVSARKLARWNGTSWQEFTGTSSVTSLYSIEAVTELPNGNIVVGGEFSGIAGVAANSIAMWNGATWSPLGSGMISSATNPAVLSLQALPNGDVVAGGRFTTAGGVPANRIARWDGSTWHDMAGGSVFNVLALTLLPSGELIAAGGFTTPQGATSRVAKWTGSAWEPLGDAPPARALLVLPNGDVLACGSTVSYGNLLMNGVARWNGAEWRPLGYGINVVPVDRPVTSLAALPNGELIAGGNFISAEGRVSAYWARWVDDPHPRIARQPTGKPMTAGDSIDINVVPAPGYDFNGPITYRWQRNGANLPDGALPNGTIIQGAGSDTLRLSNFHPLDAGAFRVVVYNSCGTAISNDVILAVTSDAAPADANNDGAVNALDLIEVLVSLAHRPAAPGTEADLNADGVVDLRDLSLLLRALARPD